MVKLRSLRALVILSVALVMGCAAMLAAPPKPYHTPEAAAAALIAAAEQADLAEMRAILGGDSEDLVESGDPISDRAGRRTFVNLYQERHSFEGDGARRVLVLGAEQWPFPIPLVEGKHGWTFDIEQGREEIINRRIGGNELNAIDFCQAYVEAQQQYASLDWDGDGLQEYAQRFLSDRGHKNGLFWVRQPREPHSPLGPLVGRAFAAGYLQDLYANGSDQSPRVYYGYYFRILKAQGSAAEGGAQSYLDEVGNMTKGFALVAYPAQWGVSGIMSFMVNHQGVVFEKDLGSDSLQLGAGLEVFNPDRSWNVVSASQSD